jgi:hypothetical protein
VTAAEIDGTDVRPVSTSVVRRDWGSSVFGIVAEGQARRRPSDIALVVVALALVAIASAGATEVTTIEAAVFDLIATLPGGLEPLWKTLYFLAPIVAGALLVTALVARRPRLLVTQVVAVGVAWLVGVALSATVDVPDTLSDAGIALLGHTPDFPVVLVAASAAGLWASRPYLTRPARRMLEAVFWLSAIAAAALAEGLPGAVIASVVLAWGAAALAHLCFGSPAATPSADQVAGSLRDLEVDPGGLRLAREQPWGATYYTAGSEAEVSIEVVGRDATDARLLSKLWRFIWYKDSGPTLSLTRLDQAATVVLEFLRDIRRRYPAEVTVYIVMDNLSAHWTAEIRRWAVNNNVGLLPTPTNARHLNRIECHFWAYDEFVINGSHNSNWTEFSTPPRPTSAAATTTATTPASSSSRTGAESPDHYRRNDPRHPTSSSSNGCQLRRGVHRPRRQRRGDRIPSRTQAGLTTAGGTGGVGPG